MRLMLNSKYVWAVGFKVVVDEPHSIISFSCLWKKNFESTLTYLTLVPRSGKIFYVLPQFLLFKFDVIDGKCEVPGQLA